MAADKEFYVLHQRYRVIMDGGKPRSCRLSRSCICPPVFITLSAHTMLLTSEANTGRSRPTSSFCMKEGRNHPCFRLRTPRIAETLPHQHSNLVNVTNTKNSPALFTSAPFVTNVSELFLPRLPSAVHSNSFKK